jgi:hypothetical protein
VVLKDPEPSISSFQSSMDTASASVELFRSRHNRASEHAAHLPHHLSICQLANQKVYLCLHINHAIIDAHSRGIIERDLQTAYDTELDLYEAPFKHAITYLKQQPQKEAGRYWSKYLDGVEPCHFPSITAAGCEDSGVLTVEVPDLDSNAIHAICQTWETTPATIIQTAWALLLTRYTGSTSACFGNLSSGRDFPIDGVNDIFGPLITMLTCRIHFNKETTVLEALQSMQRDYMNSLPYQTYSLADVHHLLGLGTSALFNTILTLQRIDNTDQQEVSGITLDFQDSVDPTEVSMFTGEPSKGKLTLFIV